MYRGLAWLTLASAVFALAGSHALTRSRLTAAVLRARFGWCGALPVRARTTHGALVALTAAALIAAVLLGSIFLGCVAITAPHRHSLGLGLLALDGGLVVGTFTAAVRALRAGAAARSRHADGIREPLFAWPRLDDSRLPHLPDWQRRCALVRWRGGGGFALVGIVLAGVPMGAAVLDVAGLVLLALSLAWLAVVMRACADVTGAASCLLDATPVPAGCMRRVALRYPLVAMICAMGLAVGGVLLLRGSVVSIVAWIVCAGVVSLWPLVRTIKTLAPPGRPT